MSKIKFDKDEQYKILDCTKYVDNPSNDVGVNDKDNNKAVSFYRICDRLNSLLSDSVSRETCPPTHIDLEKMGIDDDETLNSIREIIKTAFRYGYYAGMIDNNEYWTNEE